MSAPAPDQELWRCVDPAATGYRPLYHHGMRCPACGGGHWHIGRGSAECAFCTAAVPLASPSIEAEAA